MIKEKREKKNKNNNLANNSVATSSSNNTNDNMASATDEEQTTIKTEQDDETKKIKEEPGEDHVGDKCHSPRDEKQTDLPDIKTEDLLNDPTNASDGLTGSGDLLDSKNDILLPEGMCGKSMNADSVQPLPSNVINKQPGTMEAQYMQQQSQIFVFSTQLANKAAEGVLGGNFPSIISYHCSQPKTKKYLEKHPLKIHQFNRQNSNQWLNTLVQMKKGPMKGPVGPRDSFKSNMMGMGPGGHMMGPGPNNMGMGMCGPGGPGGMMQGMGHGPMGHGPGGMGHGPGPMSHGPGGMGHGPGGMGHGPVGMGHGPMGHGPGGMSGPGGHMGPGPGNNMGMGPGMGGPGGMMGPGAMNAGPRGIGPGPGAMGHGGLSLIHI